jgi:hypothetical protein
VKILNYKGIETENKWMNGSWYTYFSMNGEVIKTVEWNGTFSEDDVKQVINTQIIPFL